MIDITVNVDEKLSINKFNVDEECHTLLSRRALRHLILSF